MTAASGVAEEFRIVLPLKVKIKNTTSSVYSRLYDIWNGIGDRKDAVGMKKISKDVVKKFFLKV